MFESCRAHIEAGSLSLLTRNNRGVSSRECPLGIVAHPHVGVPERQRVRLAVMGSLLLRLDEGNGHISELLRCEQAQIERVEGHPARRRIEPRLLPHRLGDPACRRDENVVPEELPDGVQLPPAERFEELAFESFQLVHVAIVRLSPPSESRASAALGFQACPDVVTAGTDVCFASCGSNGRWVGAVTSSSTNRRRTHSSESHADRNLSPRPRLRCSNCRTPTPPEHSPALRAEPRPGDLQGTWPLAPAHAAGSEARAELDVVPALPVAVHGVELRIDVGVDPFPAGTTVNSKRSPRGDQVRSPVVRRCKASVTLSRRIPRCRST
jgi:hypothetical protein